MAGVDDKIVSMQFDNADFERRLSQTLQSLDKLNSTIDRAGTNNGIGQLAAQASAFNTGHMASAIDAINGKLSALGVVGATVVSKLTSGFLGMANNLVQQAKTDVLSPIITGGKQRAMDLQQAKFQFQGLGIDVNKGMASALAAVKGTAYGLNDAATVAAQFGASGIKAGDQMTRALTGISGIAAMTGRSYGEIGQIFTSMAGQGKVSSMDLMEFGIRGVNAAAAYGQQIGKSEAQVRQMVSSGKVDFASFADAMDKAFGQHAKDANQTYAGSLDNLHAALSRMGASFFSDRLVQERDLFNAITPVVDGLTTALQPLTTEFLKLGRESTDAMVKFFGSLKFDKFAPAIKDFVKVIADGAVMIHDWVSIIHDAFQRVFPPNLAFDLEKVGLFFDRLVLSLTPTGPAIKEFKDVFVGLFSIFSIAENVIKGVVLVIGSFFGAFKSQDGSSALSLLDRIGQALFRLEDYLVFSGRMNEFFQKLANYAKEPAQYIERLVADIKNLFTTTAGSGAAQTSLDNIHKGFTAVTDTAGKLQGVLGTLLGYLDNAWSHISTWFSQLGTTIANSVKPNMFTGVISAINVGLIGGIALAIKKFMDSGLKIDLGGGLFGQIKSSLDGVTTTMKTMQTELKAKMLLEIAGAIAVLAASLTVLAMIKPQGLQQALFAMTVGFTQLVLVMKILNDISSGVGGSAKLTLLGAAMVAMAGSVLVLAGAVKVLSGIDGSALAKGLTAIAVSLALLIGAAKAMSSGGVGMAAAGASMVAMATGLAIMAGAVRLFALMSWGEIAKGLVAIGGALAIIALTMNLMPVASTIAAGLAMIPLAIGLTILVGVIRLFATMSWGQLAEGLVGLAAGLVIIAVAMRMMPLTLPITAAGLVLVAVALGLMVPSIKMIGGMDIGSLAKALGGLAVMLLILAVATNAMSEAIVGAAALLIVANAMLVLSVVLRILGSMSWTQILTGLGALAGVLAVLGIGAALLEPVIPALLALGVALALVGVGFALFGAGAFLVATAFSIMAVAGAAGAAAIVAALVVLIKALPTFAGQLIVSLEQSVTTLLKAAGPMVQAIGQILDLILKVVIKEVPMIAKAIAAIIDAAIVLLRKEFPKILQAGFDLLMQFLQGLQNNMPALVTEVVNIIVTFANTLTANVKRLVDAAVNLLTAFISALASRAPDIAFAGLNVLVHLLDGIANNIGRVVTAVGNIITTFINAIGGEAVKIITAGTNMIVHIVTGLGNAAGQIATAATNTAIAFVNGIEANYLRFIDAAGHAILAFLQGIDAYIKKYEPQIIAAFVQVGVDLAKGAVQGLNKSSGGLLGTVAGIFSDTVKVAKKVTGQSSPSKAFAEIGKNLMLGAAQGVNNETSAEDSVVTKAEAIVDAFAKTMSKVPDVINNMGEFNPTITPILDLSKVQNGARGLGALLAASPITPGISAAQAGVIATTADLLGKGTDQTAPPPPSQVVFNQTINSPTALSVNDIYRNTNSQIARAKEELNI